MALSMFYRENVDSLPPQRALRSVNLFGNVVLLSGGAQAEGRFCRGFNITVRTQIIIYLFVLKIYDKEI